MSEQSVEYCASLESALASCNAAYSNEERLDMYVSGRDLIHRIRLLMNTVHELHVPGVSSDGRLIYNPESCRLTIESLKIGHNDIQVMFASDYVSKRILRNVLDEWKIDDPITGRPPIISRYYGNGYGTAYIIPLQ